MVSVPRLPAGALLLTFFTFPLVASAGWHRQATNGSLGVDGLITTPKLKDSLGGATRRSSPTGGGFIFSFSSDVFVDTIAASAPS